METSEGGQGWKPDVLFDGVDGGQIVVECFVQVVGYAASSILSGTRSRPVNEFARIGARLVDKARQASQRGGWLVCELDDGMFGPTSWYTAGLHGLSLVEKTTALKRAITSSMAPIGDVHGLVVLSPPAPGAGSAKTVSPEDRVTALRRLLLGGRCRETFVLPFSDSGIREQSNWVELFDSEPTWLNWALGQLDLPDIPRGA